MLGVAFLIVAAFSVWKIAGHLADGGTANAGNFTLQAAVAAVAQPADPNCPLGFRTATMTGYDNADIENDPHAFHVAEFKLPQII